MDSTQVITRQDSASTASSSTSTTSLDIDPATFKSTLPPRKRAKTQEEKEQRKIERILRNRRAAHASREKKRKHVEYLENYVLKLEENLSKMNNNYNSIFSLLSDNQQSSVTSKLETLEDVTELKQRIHANLNGSRKSNKKLKDLDDEDIEDQDQDQDQQQEEEEEEEEEQQQQQQTQQLKQEPQSQPVSKKRKLESSINTPPPSLSSLSPMTTTTSNTTPSSTPISLKKEKILNDTMYITKDQLTQQQQHQQPNQPQLLDDIYSLKNELEDTFWNYPSPISFHDSPLQLDMESSSSCPTTNHSIADLAAISLASRANRIVSVGL